MRRAKRIGSGLLIAGVCAVFTNGLIGAGTPSAEARFPPQLLCGPTYLWVCSGPGGPDILFAGTICEKQVFEKQNGVSCVPFTW